MCWNAIAASRTMTIGDRTRIDVVRLGRVALPVRPVHSRVSSAAGPTAGKAADDSPEKKPRLVVVGDDALFVSLQFLLMVGALCEQLLDLCFQFALTLR